MTIAIALTKVDGGTILQVRAIPRAKRTEIDGVHDGAVRIKLKAPPVDGAANKSLCAFLAKRLGTTKRDVEIRAGNRSRTKSVFIADLSPDEIQRELIGETG